MLRRTRFLLPALAVASALAGRYLALPWLILVLLVIIAALALDVGLSAASRARLRQVRDERARVARLLDALPTATLLFSDGVLAYANPQARELLDLEIDVFGDVKPLPPRDALGDSGLAHAVAEVTETRVQITVDASLSGREIESLTFLTQESEVAVFLTDVTDLKRIERVRRDFVANASHELKTPVTGIQALADSLEMALIRDPERAASMAGRIQIEATRLARLVRDLLDLTRVEEGFDPDTRSPVDLAEVVAAQVEQLQGRAREKQVTLSWVQAGEGGVAVVAVPGDMRLIAANLITNAIDYNEPGGEVVVSVHRVLAEAQLVVRDSGIGISPDEQERIFERFYRIDKARSRQVGGTGLGLSLVRHAVGRHGGAIEVESTLGKGTIFTVRLPVGGGR